MIDIFKNKPPKNVFLPIKRYQNVSFVKKYEIDFIESFFQEFPEEKEVGKTSKKRDSQSKSFNL